MLAGKAPLVSDGLELTLKPLSTLPHGHSHSLVSSG